MTLYATLIFITREIIPLDAGQRPKRMEIIKRDVVLVASIFEIKSVKILWISTGRVLKISGTEKYLCKFIFAAIFTNAIKKGKILRTK